VTGIAKGRGSHIWLPPGTSLQDRREEESTVSGSEGKMVDLGVVVAAARLYPDAFLAGRLSQAGDEAVAARLGLGRLWMQRLLLCRPPQTAAEVAQIAGLIGVSAGALASALEDHGAARPPG
jgi:hypothetical protein